MLLQKIYSEDFKEETVKLVLNSGKSQAQKVPFMIDGQHIINNQIGLSHIIQGKYF